MVWGGSEAAMIANRAAVLLQVPTPKVLYTALCGKWMSKYEPFLDVLVCNSLTWSIREFERDKLNWSQVGGDKASHFWLIRDAFYILVKFFLKFFNPTFCHVSQTLRHAVKKLRSMNLERLVPQ